MTLTEWESLSPESRHKINKLAAFWEWSRLVEKRDFEYEWSSREVVKQDEVPCISSPLAP